MRQHFERILISEEDIRSRVKVMAEQINKAYAGKDLVVIGILRGSVIFLADLVRQLDIPVSFDFMAVSSYGSSTESSGIVRINYDIKTDIRGRDVLIVEDIIDTGRTLHHLVELLISKQPASLKIATLLDKPDRRQVPVDVDFIGFTIPDEFVVGYGLDYANKYRNLPFIAILKREIYE